MLVICSMSILLTSYYTCQIAVSRYMNSIMQYEMYIENVAATATSQAPALSSATLLLLYYYFTTTLLHFSNACTIINSYYFTTLLLPYCYFTATLLLLYCTFQMPALSSVRIVFSKRCRLLKKRDADF
jgi:hypothetical protein